MKKNFKKAVVRVVGIVGLVVLCMAAYYGISMFQLQNGINILNPMLCSAICVACAGIAISGAKKKANAKESVEA